MLYTAQELQNSIDHPELDTFFDPEKKYYEVPVYGRAFVNIQWWIPDSSESTKFKYGKKSIPVQVWVSKDNPKQLFSRLYFDNGELGRIENPILQVSKELVTKWLHSPREIFQAAVADAIVRAIGPDLPSTLRDERLSVDQLINGEFESNEYLLNHLTWLFVDPPVGTEYLLQMLLQGSPYQQMETLNRIKALTADANPSPTKAIFEIVPDYFGLDSSYQVSNPAPSPAEPVVHAVVKQTEFREFIEQFEEQLRGILTTDSEVIVGRF